MIGVNRCSGRWVLCVLPTVLSAGCLDGPVPSAVRLDVTGVAPSAEVSDLAAVLREVVTEDGRVNPDALGRVVGRLDAQLRRMAVAGPTATPGLYPTYGSRWAYWYNARTAWSLKLAAVAGCPREGCPADMGRQPFPLDGRRMSLAEIDRILLREARGRGDFRLAACAPGVRLSFAPMPKRPWSGEDFDDRLAEAFNRLVLDERRFVVDVEKKQVRVPPMLWACRELVGKLYESEYGTTEATLITAIGAYVGPAARRRLEGALGYEAVGRQGRAELAIPRRKIYFPGRIGKVEP